MKALIKKLYDDTIIPTKGSNKAAGLDLYAHLNKESLVIEPQTTEKIGTGIAVKPPIGHFGAILPRSGLASKYGLRPANTPGCADEDYTGEYCVALHNDSNKPRIINNGDRIAQLVFIKYEEPEFTIVNELPETERGSNGFGSTGK